MKLNDLLDYTLRDLLDEFGTVYNDECGYYYGVVRFDDIERLYEEYNISEDYPEAFDVENLISDEIIISFDDEVLEYPKLVKIMKDLGISKKK